MLQAQPPAPTFLDPLEARATLRNQYYREWSGEDLTCHSSSLNANVLAVSSGGSCWPSLILTQISMYGTVILYIHIPTRMCRFALLLKRIDFRPSIQKKRSCQVVVQV